MVADPVFHWSNRPLGALLIFVNCNDSVAILMHFILQSSGVAYCMAVYCFIRPRIAELFCYSNSFLTNSSKISKIYLSRLCCIIKVDDLYLSWFVGTYVIWYFLVIFKHKLIRLVIRNNLLLHTNCAMCISLCSSASQLWLYPAVSHAGKPAVTINHYWLTC